jgi:hypothetical protein
MTAPDNPFAARPDPVLGSALRAALEPGGTGAFVARVLERWEPARDWGILATWARHGIPAAALLAGLVLLVALWTGLPTPDALVAASSPGPDRTTALLVAETPPDPGALFASLFDARMGP